MTQTEWKNTFGDNLSDILNEQGMSQSQLSKDTGIAISRISEYINAKATPSIYAIINMAYALDMDISEFVDFGERVY